MAIRYDAELNREIRRAVSNYNKRVKRMLAQEGDLDIELVRVADLKKQFDKRRDLLYELSRMEMIRGDSSSIEKAFKRDIRRAKIKLNYEIKRRRIKRIIAVLGGQCGMAAKRAGFGRPFHFCANSGHGCTIYT